MADGTLIAARALTKMRAHGTAYTLTRAAVTPSAASPWQPAATTSATYTVYGMLADYSATERAAAKIETTDRRYLIAASGLAVVPRPGDTMADGETVLAVVEVETAARYKDTDILYYLRVRK